jgi:hypothetical protein
MDLFFIEELIVMQLQQFQPPLGLQIPRGHPTGVPT